jgi:hypothetical protein
MSDCGCFHAVSSQILGAYDCIQINADEAGESRQILLEDRPKSGALRKKSGSWLGGVRAEALPVPLPYLGRVRVEMLSKIRSARGSFGLNTRAETKLYEPYVSSTSSHGIPSMVHIYQRVFVLSPQHLRAKSGGVTRDGCCLLSTIQLLEVTVAGRGNCTVHKSNNSLTDIKSLAETLWPCKPSQFRSF